MTNRAIDTSDSPVLGEVWDTRPDRPMEIASFIHCAECVAYLLDLGDDAPSPRDYAWLQAGLTSEGHLQFWCNRHEKNIVIIQRKETP